MSTDPDRLKLIQETKASLERIQHFDNKTLPRVEELGSSLNFSDAVEPAHRLIDLYQQLPVEVLDSLPTTRLTHIREQANSDYTFFDQILKFSHDQANPKSVHDQYVQQLATAYDPAFEKLHPFISYAVRKSTDFAQLEREARSVVQSVTDRANELQETMEANQKEAEGVLEAIRRVAAEQGVSQQAIHFKNEADEHAGHAQRWLWCTIILTVVLAGYAVGTLFLHKWPLLSPANTYDSVQLAVSKILVFATISFFLLLSAKSFTAHRHNAVINRHRQNALVTYQALVKAAGEEGNRDIVLTKASECIFSPQPTGFGKAEPGDGSAFSVVSVAPGAIRPAVPT